MQSIKDILTAWNNNNSDRVKLQHAYLAVALIGVVIAGLVGLVNDRLSQLIVDICIAALGIFIVNVLAWAILYSLIVTKLPLRRGNASRK